MKFWPFSKNRRRTYNQDVDDVRRRQKRVELELKQVEQTVAIARRRGSSN